MFLRCYLLLEKAIKFTKSVKNTEMTQSVDDADTFDDDEHPFMIPTKLVKNISDLSLWEKSEAYFEIVGFINSVGVAIQGIRISEQYHVSENVQKLLELLQQLNKLLDETPPTTQPQRFGNKAFRDWHTKMVDISVTLLQQVLPPSKHRAVPEIATYLTDAFGNPTRIDYGTGHELTFIMFLTCLFKIKFLDKTDEVAVCLKVFNAYLIFVRRLQQTYRMEPAGSQGVWSLDDYQFIPFIWGSAQLSYQAPIEPAQFSEPNIVAKYKGDYMFFGCIDYILKVKTGMFAEHSNQLWSISAVPQWSKINAGLIKMYCKEILSKFPAIQHVLFGSLLKLNPVKPGTILPQSRLGFISQPRNTSTNKLNTLCTVPKTEFVSGSGDQRDVKID